MCKSFRECLAFNNPCKSSIEMHWGGIHHSCLPGQHAEVCTPKRWCQEENLWHISASEGKRQAALLVPECAAAFCLWAGRVGREGIMRACTNTGHTFKHDQQETDFIQTLNIPEPLNINTSAGDFWDYFQIYVGVVSPHPLLYKCLFSIFFLTSI